MKNRWLQEFGGLRSVNPVQLPVGWYCILTVVSSPKNPQNRRWKFRLASSLLCSYCSSNSFDGFCRETLVSRKENKKAFLLHSARLSNETCTLFPARLQTLLVGLEAVSVSSAAAVPEARAATGGGIIVPVEDEFGTGSFLFGKLADVHSCRECWEEKKQIKKTFRVKKQSYLHSAFHITREKKCLLLVSCCGVETFINPLIKSWREAEQT